MANELDLTFDNDGVVVIDGAALGIEITDIQDVAVQDDGKVIVVGAGIQSGRSDKDMIAVRYNRDGSVDRLFEIVDSSDGDDVASSIEIQSDGSVVIAGSIDTKSGSGEDVDFAVARFTSDGVLDGAFGQNGLVTTDFGDIPVLESYSFKDDGSIDKVATNLPEFSHDIIRKLVLQPDGKIVVVGDRNTNSFGGSDITLARYNFDGSLDPSFGEGSATLLYDATLAAGNPNVRGDVEEFGVGIDKDGRVVTSILAIVDQGTDVGSDIFGKGYKEANSIFLQDSKIIVVGKSSYNGPIDQVAPLTIRYSSSGELDNSFESKGSPFPNGIFLDNTGPSSSSDITDIRSAALFENTIKILGVELPQDQEHSGFDIDYIEDDKFVDIDLSSDGSSTALVGSSFQLSPRLGDTGKDFKVEIDDSLLPGLRGIDNITSAEATTVTFFDQHLVVAGEAIINNQNTQPKFVIARYGEPKPNRSPNDIVFVNTSNRASVGENQPFGTAVGTLDAVDADDTSHSYELLAVSDLNGNPVTNSSGELPFKFVDPNSGLLVTNDVFNHEENSQYRILVRATDAAGGFIGQYFDIEITNLNDISVANSDSIDIVVNSRVDIPFDLLLANDEDEDFETPEIKNFSSHFPHSFPGVIVPQGPPNESGYITFNEFVFIDEVENSLEFGTSVAGTYTFFYNLENSDPSSFATVTINVLPDEDSDGVADQVEDNAPNGGDGNNDGIQDSQQATVASLPIYGTTDSYATLELKGDGNTALPSGSKLVGVKAINNPSPGNAPGVEFPIGFFDFTVDDIAPGSSVDVNLILEEAASFNSYFKYGPSPEKPYDSWFDFQYDGTTGAEIVSQNQLTLHLTDGQRGDTDILGSDGTIKPPNGRIVDPGAPGISVAPGLLDPNFGTDGKVNIDFYNGDDFGTDVVLQPDGKFIVVGAAEKDNGFKVLTLTRHNSDGSLDIDFGEAGRVITESGSQYRSIGYEVALQSDGKIVVVGANDIKRYNIDGSLDESFSSSYRQALFGFDMDDIIVQPDDKILLAGVRRDAVNGADFAVVRLNSDGSPDSTFGENGRVVTHLGATEGGNSLSLQSDGKVVVAGQYFVEVNVSDFAVVRYNPDGTLDTSFGDNGKVITDVGGFHDTAFGVTIQPDGKIVAVGETKIQGTDISLVRYNSDGSLDSTFGNAGKVITDLDGSRDRARDVMVQDDGKIVVIGQGGFGNFAAIRYNSDGSLDSTFGDEGKVLTDFFESNDSAVSGAIQSDGKILAAGSALVENGYDFAIARYVGERVNRSPIMNFGVSLDVWAHDIIGDVAFQHAFVDPDGDLLTYSATQEDGAPLPDWLGFRFDSEENLIIFSNSGVPADFSGLQVKLTANDPQGATVETIVPLNPVGSGVVIDNYVADAAVFFDGNKNRVLDNNEPFTTTDEFGAYQLQIPASFDINGNGKFDAADGYLVAFGGVDIASGVPLNTPFTASPNATVITPLTTLVINLVEQGLSVEQATDLVRASLAISSEVNLNEFDPVAAIQNGQVEGRETLAAMVKVQTLITQAANLLAGATGTPLESNLDAVISAITSEIQTTGSLNLTSVSEIGSIIEAAATAKGVDASLTPQVAQVISEANQLFNVATLSASTESIEEEFANIQKVALGATATDLQAVGAGTKTIDEVVAANTGDALRQQVENAGNTNTPPTVTEAIADQSAASGTAFSFNLPTGSFSDEDAGDALTYAATLANGDPLPDWLSFDPATQSFSGTPASGDVGTLSITVTATDSQDAAVSDTFELDVASGNAAPINLSLSATTIDENVAAGTQVGTLSTTDPDAGDSFTYELVSGEGDANNSAFEIVNGSDLQIKASPDFEAQASYSVRVRTADQDGLSYEKALTIQVNDLNEAPVLEQAIADQSAISGTAFSFNLPAGSFSDEDAGDALTYEATLANGDPLPDWLSFDPVTQSFSGTPASGDVGTLSIIVTATDSQDVAVSDTYELSILEAETPVPSDKLVIEGTSRSDNLNGTQKDELIIGGAGNDQLNANGGEDYLDGGAGNDRINGSNVTNIIRGGTGNDVINTNGGNNFVDAGEGRDRVNASHASEFIRTGDGDDTVNANGGYDVIITGSGRDRVNAGSQSDFIATGDGDDRVYGNGGDDTIYLGAGNDTVYTGFGNAFISTGTGNDTVYIGGGQVTVLLETGPGFDTIRNFQKGQTKLGLADGLMFEDLDIAYENGRATIQVAGDKVAVLENAYYELGADDVTSVNDPLVAFDFDQVLAKGALTKQGNLGFINNVVRDGSLATVLTAQLDALSAPDSTAT